MNPKRRQARLEVLLATLFLMAACKVLPTDKTLEERFRNNQANFEKLVSMLKQDTDVILITSKHAFMTETATRKLPNERLAEYRRLMKVLKLEGGIQRYDLDRMLLLVSDTGIALPNSGKCYAYSIPEPHPLVESLDELIKRNSGDQQLVYKKLTGNWYLCYESW